MAPSRLDTTWVTKLPLVAAVETGCVVAVRALILVAAADRADETVVAAEATEGAWGAAGFGAVTAAVEMGAEFFFGLVLVVSVAGGVTDAPRFIVRLRRWFCRDFLVVGFVVSAGLSAPGFVVAGVGSAVLVPPGFGALWSAGLSGVVVDESFCRFGFFIFLSGFSDFGLVAADGLSVDDAEAPVLVLVSARQMAGLFATAMPMPRATASVPTRPMNRAWPDPAGLPMRCSVVAVSIYAPKVTNNCHIDAK